MTSVPTTFVPAIAAPSILSADFANLERDIKSVTQAGADWIHVDIMDGHFVPNLTIGAPVVASLRKVTKLILDVHLMIENPDQYIPDFAKAGSDMITFHVEASKDVMKTIELIRSLGKKVGITSRPATAISEILPYIGHVDMVLIMTVNPGFGGQSFMADQVEKIRAVRAANPSLLIEVDGGINETTAQTCFDAGARVFVAGNFVFKNDHRTAIGKLKGLS